LFAVLAIWPVAQTHFFPLTPVVAAGAMAGHWVYGSVLGWLTRRWLPPVHPADLAARSGRGRVGRAVVQPGSVRQGRPASVARAAAAHPRPVRPFEEQPQRLAGRPARPVPGRPPQPRR